MATPQLRPWFYQETTNFSRFRNGDEPVQNTFETLTQSVPFRLDSKDKAKTNLSGATTDIATDIQGLVVMAKDIEAKTRTENKSDIGTPLVPYYDRSIAVSPAQLPETKVEYISPVTTLGWSSQATNPLQFRVDPSVTQREVYQVWIDKAILTNYINSLVYTSGMLWQTASRPPFGTCLTQGAGAASNDVYLNNNTIIQKNLNVGLPSVSNFRLVVGSNYTTFDAGFGVQPVYHFYPWGVNTTNGLAMDLEAQASQAMQYGHLRMIPWPEIRDCPSCNPGGLDAMAPFGYYLVVDNDSDTYSIQYDAMLGRSYYYKAINSAVFWLAATTSSPTNAARGIGILPVPAFNGPAGITQSDVRELAFTQTQEVFDPENEGVRKKWQKSIVSVISNGGVRIHKINPFTNTNEASSDYSWVSLKNLSSYRNVVFIEQDTTTWTQTTPPSFVASENSAHFQTQGKAWFGETLSYGHYISAGSYQKLDFVMKVHQDLLDTLADLAPFTFAGTDVTSLKAEVQAQMDLVKGKVNDILASLRLTNILHD